jgi:hypothetical protein
MQQPNLAMSSGFSMTVSGLNFGVGEHTASGALASSFTSGEYTHLPCETSSWSSATSVRCYAGLGLFGAMINQQHKQSMVVTVGTVAGTQTAQLSFDGARNRSVQRAKHTHTRARAHTHTSTHKPAQRHACTYTQTDAHLPESIAAVRSSGGEQHQPWKRRADRRSISDHQWAELRRERPNPLGVARAVGGVQQLVVDVGDGGLLRPGVIRRRHEADGCDCGGGCGDARRTARLRRYGRLRRLCAVRRAPIAAASCCAQLRA